MANTLIVTDGHDYSKDKLSDIGSIVFNASTTGGAQFAAKQFGPQISNAVQIIGGPKSDFLVVNLGKLHKFSAAAWVVTNWSAGDGLFLQGTAMADKITGPDADAGAIILHGGHGGDVLRGGTANNFYTYSRGDIAAGEKIFGGDLLDTIEVRAGTKPVKYDFTHVAMSGVEQLSMWSGDSGGAAIVTLTAAQIGAFRIAQINDSSQFHNTLIIKGKAVSLLGVNFSGWTNNDDIIKIQGTKGDDSLTGSSQNDRITGGTGQDHMRGSGGADIFIFKSPSDSPKGEQHRDVIQNFEAVDKIDLSAIDANGTKAGNGTFHFVGTGELQHRGDLHVINNGASLLVEGDINGDGKADFQIEVAGIATLLADHFIL